MNTKLTVKDFFLHLGAIITFYASTIALITLLFEAINYAYPQIANAYQYYSPSISLQVAILIVAFPLFLLLSWLLQKTYVSDPALREAPIRKGLAYLTLFVAGAVVAGDLITVIYMFLDGQELTTGFLLKVLALLVIVGGIFLYFLREIKNIIGSGERNIWRIVAIVIILGSIILGFSVVGSPATQRARRHDSQKVSDLQNIQWQIVNHWQQKGLVPANLEGLADSISGFSVPVDPQTKETYVYKKTGALSFELCANFNKPSQTMSGSVTRVAYPEPIGKSDESWQHEAGLKCFPRTIDPELYPVRSKI